MRNLAVVVAFLFSIVGLFHTVTAEANSVVRVEQTVFTPPVELSERHDAEGIAADKKKKKKQDDKDEEDEEDYRALSGLERLRLVDPVALDAVINSVR